MKTYYYIFALLLFSCNSEIKTTQKPIKYTQDLLNKCNLNLDLPILNNGISFIKNDSTNYINIFIINDSTIRLDNFIYNLIMKNPDTKKYKYIQQYNRFKNIRKIIDSISSESSLISEINIFMNQNSEMEVYKSLNDELSNLYYSRLNFINIIGANNTSISINIYKNKPGQIICYSEQQIFEILLNKDNQIMIENNWKATLDSIPKNIIKYLEKEETSRLITRENILERISQIKINTIRRVHIQKKQNLNKWNKALKVHDLIGDFKKTSSYNFISIEYDNKSKYKYFTQIIDKICEGTISLKDNYCQNKFGLNYTSLSIKDTNQIKIKEALDYIYPNIIWSNFPFTPPPPSPMEDN